MNNEKSDLELKEKIKDFKSNLLESIGFTSQKIEILEKEIMSFNENAGDPMADPGNEIEGEKYLNQLARLYRAENSYSKFLQDKIIDLELKFAESNQSQVSLPVNDIKNILKSEFEELTTLLLNKINLPTGEITYREADELQDHGSFTLEEKKELEKEFASKKFYYESKIETLQNELLHRVQEIKSFNQSTSDIQPSTDSRKLPEENFTTIEEEFEFVKSEVNSLRSQNRELENELIRERQIINENYKTELTDLKNALGEKNVQIKELKQEIGKQNYKIAEAPKDFLIDNKKLIEEMEHEIISLKLELKEQKISLEDKVKEFNIQISNVKRLESQIKQLNEENRAFRNETKLVKANQELDNIIKALWKIEKNIGIFEKTSDINEFERHLEVYSVLLGKVFNSNLHALILDCLLKNKGKVLNKKLIINDSGIEHFLTIKILREFRDEAKILSFDEETDQIDLYI